MTRTPDNSARVVRKAATEPLVAIASVVSVMKKYRLSHKKAVEAREASARRNTKRLPKLLKRHAFDKAMIRLRRAEEKYPGILSDIRFSQQSDVSRRYTSESTGNRLSRSRVSQIAADMATAVNNSGLTLDQVVQIVSKNRLPMSINEELLSP